MLGILIAVESDGVPTSVIVNTGPEKMWRVNPGEVIYIKMSTGDITYKILDMAQAYGTEDLTLYLIISDKGQYVNGEYISPLPLLKNLPNRADHRWNHQLAFELFTPKSQSEENEISELSAVFMEMVRQ